MKRVLRITEDGSHTMEVGLGDLTPSPGALVTYHSIHGAIQESMHVYIEAGFRAAGPAGPLHVFEMGFGTGLNALLTYGEALARETPVFYQTIEQLPLGPDEYKGLNYEALMITDPEKPSPLKGVLQAMHEAPWEVSVQLHPMFTLHKIKGSFLERAPKEGVDIIYYDAFAPDAQPELWQIPVFEKLHHLLKPGGILVTYCSKGEVRRGLMAAGFTVERLAGPPGKREMLRARRPLIK